MRRLRCDLERAAGPVQPRPSAGQKSASCRKTVYGESGALNMLQKAYRMEGLDVRVPDIAGEL